MSENILQTQENLDLIAEVFRRTGINLGAGDPIATSYICLTQLLLERQQKSFDDSVDKAISRIQNLFDSTEPPVGIIQRVLGAAGFLRKETEAVTAATVDVVVRKTETEARAALAVVVAEEVRKAMDLENARIDALRDEFKSLNASVTQLALAITESQKKRGFLARLFS